jgi:hypothetical protein
MINTLAKSLMFVFLIAFSVTGQDKQTKPAETIDNAVAKLQQKVLLTDQQASEVKSILNRELNSIQNGGIKETANAKKDVEDVLDSKQKAKYAIIKDNWWSNLISSLKASD